MLTPEAMLNLAAELTDAAAERDAESLAAIAWRLYGEAGENLAEIGRLRAAIHAAWNRPQQTVSPAPAAACNGTAGTGAPPGSTAMPRAKANPGRRRDQTNRPSRPLWGAVIRSRMCRGGDR
jgi:hypothetical protein